MQDPRSYVFSLDLVKTSPDHVSFLQEVSTHHALQNVAVLRQALYRYEHLWLPLAAKWPHEALAAPLDIEWVWHCHLLSPVAYQRDCMSIVGTIVDHHLFSQKERAKRLNRSRTLWTSEYPHQPFDQDPGCPEDPRASAPSKLTYDIIAAAERQSVFFYQVSLPHFRDRKFLNAAEARYRKFLWLKQQNPRLFIVPCYDIDLIWHTHQLHPVGYKKDMEAVLGHTFNHDDSVTDRSEGSKLYNSDMETRELWRNTFGENFALYGAMYRGDPPAGKLYAMTEGTGVCAVNQVSCLSV
ncbi:hypothetical protein BaRGS_00024636 [Batillaria attramentaria]|uniref:Uncharacterized protein n=1 Tax=Batillaria attramentaria TaxID=370345 RepID=A0ABD0KAQ4_9CAEN